MPSPSVLKAANRIQVEYANSTGLEAAHIATIIEEDVGLADAITALRKCDKVLEQQGVSVNQRDFVLKALAKLEGAEPASPADAVIGTMP